MVKLSEIPSDYSQKVMVEDETLEDEEDEYSTYSDDDYDEVENESLWERISALQDIVPAEQRRAVSKGVQTIINAGSTAFSFVGKAAWVISTTAFVVALPLLFELDRADAAAAGVGTGQNESLKVGEETQEKAI